MKARLKGGKVITGRLANTFANLGLAIQLEEKENVSAKKIAEQIELCNTIDELNVFESDKRQVVQAAYRKKLRELNN